MAFRTYNRQTTGFAHFGSELDVGASTCHVGGDCNGALAACQCHNLGLTLVEFGIEHLMRNFLHLQHFGEQFRDFHTRGAHQNRTTGVHQGYNLLDNCTVFGFLGAVHAVVEVEARNRTVCRDSHHIELVDVPELAGLGYGGTGHAGELVVHAEVVLQCDGGESLCGGLHLHTFLGFDGLVQTVGIAASFHDAAGLLVDDFYLVIVDNIFDVAVEKSVCLQQLCDCVHTFALHGIFGHKRILPVLLLHRVGDMFQFAELCGDIGQDKECGVLAMACEFIDALVGEFHRTVLFVDHKIQRIGYEWHLAGVVLQVVAFGLQKQIPHAFLAKETNQSAVLRQTLESAEQKYGAFFLRLLVFGGQFGFGLGKDSGNQTLLGLDHFLHIGLVLVEELVVAARHRAGYDERSTGVVDKHGVDLVDDCIVVFTLHQVKRIHGHVVAQIVEAEFVVGAVCDVALVGLAAFG